MRKKEGKKKERTKERKKEREKERERRQRGRKKKENDCQHRAPGPFCFFKSYHPRKHPIHIIPKT